MIRRKKHGDRCNTNLTIDNIRLMTTRHTRTLDLGALIMVKIKPLVPGGLVNKGKAIAFITSITYKYVLISLYFYSD